jgi:nucleotide-binding universal stress UspA family protein
MAGIVVGVDGSTGSARALDWALHAAALYRQPLTVVAVVPTAVLPTGWSTRPVAEPATPAELEATRQAVQELLERARAARPEAERVETEVRIEHGVPAEVLLGYADTAEHLVVGSRGMGGFKRLLLGSVSTALTHHARCPTTVVPEHGPDQPTR